MRHLCQFLITGRILYRLKVIFGENKIKTIRYVNYHISCLWKGDD